MPYSGPSDPKLPSNVKKKPLKKRRQWVRIFNSVFRRTGSDGQAMRAANGATKELTVDSIDVLKLKLKELGEDGDAEQRAFLEQAIKGLHDEGEKFHDDVEAIAPFGFELGGAINFIEADSWQDARDVEENVRDQKRMFDAIYSNIWARGDMAVATKTNLIQQAAAELANRTANPPAEKSLLQKAKDWLMQDPQGKEKSAKETDPVNRFYFTKDAATGGIRWLAIVTNKYYDRDEEVFPDEAHKEYEAYLDAGGLMPTLRIWHTPGTDFGQADFMSYDDGFMLSSGLVTPGQESIAKSLASSKETLAVSHGYRFEEKDYNKADGSIRCYRMFEISVLPAEVASNLWTAFTVPELIKEVSMPIKEDKRAFLAEHLGEERTANIETVIGNLGKELTAAGIGWKDLFQEEEGDEKPAAAASGSEESGAAASADGDEKPSADDEEKKEEKKEANGDEKPAEVKLELSGGANAEAFLGEVKEAVSALIAPLSTAVVELQAGMKELSKTDDQKQSEQMQARGREPVAASHRPSESERNIVDPENSEAAKAVAEAASEGQKDGDPSDGQRYARNYVESFLLGGKSLNGESSS